MKLFPKILTVATSVLLAAGSLAVAPIGANQSASAETIISQLGSDIDGEAVNDYSGYSVSLSSDGTRVAIGAYSNDGNGNSSGHVRIYELSGGTWSQLGSDIDGEAANDNSGYSVSLSSDGTRVAIGAYSNDGNGNSSGHVRIYELSGGTWSQLGSDIDGEAAFDQSGSSVSLSSDGTRVAIGAPYNDGTSSNAGHVRVYEYSGGTWNQLGSDIEGEAADDNSGYSVSLSSDGTRVAIGAYGNDGTDSDAGHVRVYEWNDGTSSWDKLGSDIEGEAADDYSGRSVSLSSDGTRVAIGAPFNDGNGNASGHVRVYEFSGGDWSQLGSDIDGEAADDNSGYSVSLSSDGTTVAIGAIYNDGTGSNAGHVRIYKLSGGTWSQLGSDIDGEAANDYSGLSVSLSSDGTSVAIGAPYNDGSFSNAGHVRVHSMSTSSPAPAPAPAPVARPYVGPTSLSVSKSAPANGAGIAIGDNLESIDAIFVGGLETTLEITDVRRMTFAIPNLDPGNHVVKFFVAENSVYLTAISGHSCRCSSSGKFFIKAERWFIQWLCCCLCQGP